MAKSKYRNVPMVVDGIRFHSKAEARRWAELSLAVKSGDIRELRRQMVFPLYSMGCNGILVQVDKYVADFTYTEMPSLKFIVEDVKGYRTADYKRKRRWMKDVMGITITEIDSRRIK